MASLEKSCRKVKKEKKPKTATTIRDNEGEHRLTLISPKKESRVESATTALKESGKLSDLRVPVASTIIECSTNQVHFSTSECREVASNISSKASTSQEPLLQEKCQHRLNVEGEGSESSTSVAETDTSNLSDKVVGQGSTEVKSQSAPRVTVIPEAGSSLVFNTKAHSNINDATSPSAFTKRTKDPPSSEGLDVLKSEKGDVHLPNETISEKVRVENFGDKSLRITQKPDYMIPSAVRSPLVIATPSAPSCDISVEEDNLGRIRCLEESSLRNLYPLTAFHIAFASESVIRSHPLYVLLCDYLLACNHLDRSRKKHGALAIKAEKLKETVWSVTEKEVVETGKCKDDMILSSTYCKCVAVKNKKNLYQLGCTLSSARDALHSEFSLHLFDSEAQRLRVEHYVQVEEEAQSVIPSPEELRVSVMILFSFVQRQDLNPDFIFKVQSWLLRLGKVLLKVAAPSDHLLLLSQLLRCSKGVGKWGMPLVQFNPPPPIQPGNQSVIKQCIELDLVMAALPVLIEAIDALECSPHMNSQQDKELNDTWVVLDSFGEEENNNLPGDEDLISFLNRFPLRAVVSHALGLSDVGHSPSMSGVDILRRFALSNYALKTLGSGLQKYGSRRYPRFFGKIAVLVHHIAHLVTDLWDFFKSSKHYECDPAMQARIEVEYEALFIRAFGYLFQCTRHHSGWEMLSQLPYNYLSVHTLWHLLAVFHRCGKVDCDGDITIPPGGIKGWVAEIKESCSLFDAALLAEPVEDSSLLLTTMKNMAVSSEDVTLAEAVTFDIFRVGHLIPETLGYELPKIANGLLVSIFSKHPCLFPVLIGWLEEVPQDVDKGVLDLISSLPINLWQPSKTDLKLLSSWILNCDPQTVKSAISRTIFLALPWRGCGNDEGPLPLDVTIYAASVALEACLKWDGKGRIPSTMRSESATSAWAWSLVIALCIHPLDRRNCQTWSQDAPSDYDLLRDVLSRGLQESHPLASLLSVLATQQGHTWTIAKEHAFTHLSNVVAYWKYTAAISALYQILPLFADHCDDLVNCQIFQKLFLTLLFADRTYVKMAKNLIHHEFLGPTLIQLGDMVVTLLEKSFKFGMPTSKFVVLWLRIIFQVPNWKNEMEALYLLDLIFRSAFFDSSGKGWEEALATFSQVTKQNMLHIQASTGALSSIKNLLARGPAPGSPRPLSHMSQSSYPRLPWFVLAALEIEEVHESFLWDKLQIEYRTAVSSLGNISLDTIIKNACQTLGVLPFPAAYLCIYRWVKQAVDTPVGHPALLLIWTRFFSIYSKLFSCSEQSCTILFEGSSFAYLLTQMKKKLIESVEWYAQAAESCEDHDTSLWLRHCSRVLHDYSLWLEEEKRSCQSSVQYPQYSLGQLPMVILYEHRRSWQMEFVDVSQSKNQMLNAVQAWDKLRREFKENVSVDNYPQSSHYSPPLHRIHSRLNSCINPNPLSFSSYPEPKLIFEYAQIVCGKDVASKAIVNCLTPLVEYARLSSLHFSEHSALDCAFIELLPNLYKDVWVEFTRRVPCPTRISTEDGKTISCSSPAKIAFKVKESKMSREVWSDMEKNVASRKRLITTVLKLVPLKACSSGVLLENMARELVSEKKKCDFIKIQETALCALNHLLHVLSDEAVLHCLPVKKLVTSSIENLVHEFVLGNEKPFLKLLSQMLEKPVLSEILSPLLIPEDLSTNGLLEAYSIVIKRLPSLDKNLAFVLLSKFKIRNWLSQQQSLKKERLSLVKLLLNGIACCNPDSRDGEWTLVIGILQKHLRLVVINRFPEILVEALELVLIATGDHHFTPIIWYDLMEAIVSLGCLNQSTVTPVTAMMANDSPEQWTLLVKEFSLIQKVLSLMKVKDVVNLFANFFRRERLQFGLHGIYPKYRAHVKPIEKFLELLGCCLLAKSLRERREVPASAGSPESTWISIREMYSPWLLPYWEDELTGTECTVWITELMNGHPPLTPWIASDSPLANNVAASFVKCLQFMIEISPGHQNSLGLIWEMYSSAFTRLGVGIHVLNIIHPLLLQLPWDHFWPTITNLTDMVEVAETSSPECHCFLRTVLSKVHWKEWMDSLSSSITLSSQALMCFLKVLLLLSGNTCSCKAGGCSLLSTLVAAQAISWQNLNVPEYSALLNLYVSRADPKAVLSWNSTGYDEDESIALLKLLKSAGGLAETISSKDLFQKSISFLYTIGQQLFGLIESDQYNVPSVKCSSETALLGLLYEMERLITTGSAKEVKKQVEDMADVMKQVLIPFLPNASPKFIQALSRAVAPTSVTQHSIKPILCAKGLLLALQSSSHSPIHLGLLIESAIETSLLDKISSCSPLENVHRILQNGGENMLVIGNCLSSAGYLLTLMAYLHSSCSPDINSEKSNYEEYLHQLIHRWLPSITITDDIEAKIPLLWTHSLILVNKLVKMCPKEHPVNSLEDLSILASSLMALGDVNEGMVSSLLGAVGLRRKPSISRRFIVMSLAFSAFVFACLDGDGKHQAQFKEAWGKLDKLCHRYKEFREVLIITDSVTNNLAGHSFLEGTDLLIKIFSRLYPEKPGYLQCMN